MKVFCVYIETAKEWQIVKTFKTFKSAAEYAAKNTDTLGESLFVNEGFFQYNSWPTFRDISKN